MTEHGLSIPFMNAQGEYVYVMPVAIASPPARIERIKYRGPGTSIKGRKADRVTKYTDIPVATIPMAVRSAPSTNDRYNSVCGSWPPNPVNDAIKMYCQRGWKPLVRTSRSKETKPKVEFFATVK
jgi:hypothetical protein